MFDRFDAALAALRGAILALVGVFRAGLMAASRRRWRLGIAVLLAAVAYGLYQHPPLVTLRLLEFTRGLGETALQSPFC